MATPEAFVAIALALEGTVQAPHFDRQAFKVRRTYATLAADRQSANLAFTPDEQEFRCMMNPAAFRPVPNAWGRQGWTIVELSAIGDDELKDALEAAWRRALPVKRKR